MNAVLAPRLSATRATSSRVGRKPPLLTEEAVRKLYGEGMTQAEIAVRLETTQRTVSVFMRRIGLAARPAAKRNQQGAANHMWTGTKASYIACHKRVYRMRGKPTLCEHCGVSDPDRMYHWANVSGNYPDPTDYIRLCASCHRKFDNAKRAAK